MAAASSEPANCDGKGREKLPAVSSIRGAHAANQTASRSYGPTNDTISRSD